MLKVAQQQQHHHHQASTITTERGREWLKINDICDLFRRWPRKYRAIVLDDIFFRNYRENSKVSQLSRERKRIIIFFQVHSMRSRKHNRSRIFFRLEFTHKRRQRYDFQVSWRATTQLFYNFVPQKFTLVTSPHIGLVRDFSLKINKCLILLSLEKNAVFVYGSLSHIQSIPEPASKSRELSLYNATELLSRWKMILFFNCKVVRERRDSLSISMTIPILSDTSLTLLDVIY